MTINGRGGDDTFNIGAGDFDSRIRGAVTLNGGTGADDLVIDDRDDRTDALDDRYVFNLDGITKVSSGINVPLLAFSSLATLTLEGSPGDNVFQVDATRSGTRYTLRGHDGEDEFRIAAAGLNSDVVVSGGQPSTAPGDSLHVTGTPTATASYTPDLSNPDGGVVRTRGRNISFTGLEPVSLENFDRVTMLTPRSYDIVNVSDNGDGWSKISGISGHPSVPLPFEYLTFRDVREVTLDTASRDLVPFTFPPGPSGILWPPFPNDTVNILPGALNARGLETFNILTGAGANFVNDHTLEAGTPVTGRLITNGTGGFTQLTLFATASVIEVEHLPGFANIVRARNATGLVIKESNPLFVELLVIPNPQQNVLLTSRDTILTLDVANNRQRFRGPGLTTVEAAMDSDTGRIRLDVRGESSVSLNSILFPIFSRDALEISENTDGADLLTIRVNTDNLIPGVTMPQILLEGFNIADTVVFEESAAAGPDLDTAFTVDATEVFAEEPRIVVEVRELGMESAFDFLLGVPAEGLPQIVLDGKESSDNSDTGQLLLPAVQAAQPVNPLSIELLVRNLRQLTVNGSLQSVEAEQFPNLLGTMTATQPNDQFTANIDWNSIELLVITDPTTDFQLTSRDADLTVDVNHGRQRFGNEGRTTVEAALNPDSGRTRLDTPGNSQIGFLAMLLPALARPFEIAGDPDQADTIAVNVDFELIPDVPMPRARVMLDAEDTLRLEGPSFAGQELGAIFTADARGFSTDDGRKIELLVSPNPNDPDAPLGFFQFDFDVEIPADGQAPRHRVCRT